MSIGQELLNVPMGEMIRSMAFAIAEAQLKLDHASIESAEMMGGLKTIVDDQGNVRFDDSRVFFGHEYMTLAEAVVTQGGGLNPAVDAITSAVSFTYRKHKTTTPYVGTPSGSGTPSYTEVTAPLTQQSVALYKQYTETLAAALETAKAGVASAANPTDAAPFQATVDGLLLLDKDNRASMKAVMESTVRIPTRVSLLELGFAPVFYSFVDTIIEVRISISITQENSSTTETTNTNRSVQANTAFRGIPFLRGGLSRQRTVNTSQVNATYSSRYSYTAEGSSLLRTKLSPVPTPSILDERIHAIMEADQQRQAAELAAIQNPAPLA